MLVHRSKVVLDEDYRNVLVNDFTAEYEGVETLNEPRSVVDVMEKVFRLSEMAEEYMYLICMTSKHRPISFFEVSHGTYNMTLAGMREIFIRALLCGAASMILVHNHPSGDPTPSLEDSKLTKRVQDAADLMK